MEKIIEDLEHKLADAGIKILEKRFDGFTYSIAVASKKGEYIIYFTKSFMTYRSYKKDCLRVMHTTTHIPFSTIEPINGGDFIFPYVRASMNSNCVTFYEEYFSDEKVIALMV